MEPCLMQHHILLSLILLSFGGPAYASPESTQLALALKQLDGVKNSLERARNSASADSQSRYFFDYLQAQQDLTTVEQGIRRYLTPARAQPRAVQPLSASYQRENPDD
ncbi:MULTISPECIES: RAQPRD family integrative conjugative element protein [Escherichia]|uniref:integrative conjugative element protein, RAQPRD family n=1 Tax=Escherichia TaxID=561 RepID=UPI003523D106